MANVCPTVVQLVSRGPMGPAGPPGTTGTGSPAITVNTSYTVGPSGDFTEPGAFTQYIGAFKINPNVLVTVTVASGTYNCTKQIIGHPDGARIKWVNSGLNGAALTGADFAALDAIWVIDPINGVDAASVAAAKVSAEATCRAKYKVILQWAGGSSAVDPAVRLDGHHSGDWTACPCLFINTGTCATGVTTGTGADAAQGSGGAGIFSGSCFFGFTNVNHLCDYGGALTFHNGLSMFSPQDNIRNDFAGIMYANNVISIGAIGYGYRSNHGGSSYLTTPYIHGCRIAIEVTNTPGMAWAHFCDIQYNYIGVSCNWGGSAKVFQGHVKNNARVDITINSGFVDARQCDCATTATFTAGARPIWGLYVTPAGSIVFQDGVTTGHVTDAQVQGSGVISMLGATYGTIRAGTGDGAIAPITGFLQYAPSGRPAFATAEMSGTNLVIPTPAPLTLGVVQPSGSAGTPISVVTIDLTNMPLGENIALYATNAATGETVTVTDSGTVALAAPTRALLNVRDVLVLRRLSSSAVVSEQSFNKTNSNLAFDLSSVGTFGIQAPTARSSSEAALHWDATTKEVRFGVGYSSFRTRIVTASGLVQFALTDDCLVINKATPAATAVNITSTLNSAGRVVVVKDGKGDANTNNITITPQTGTIDGAATKVINTAYGAMRLIYTGAEWATA